MGDFRGVQCVFEYGCGRGRLARALFRNILDPKATYSAVDQSAVMVANAQLSLHEFSERCEILQLASGEPRDVIAMMPKLRRHVDRFLVCYVLDLLGDEDIAAVLDLAKACCQN